MKNHLLAALASVSLIFASGSGNAREESEASAELRILVQRVHTQIDQGKKSKADLAGELKDFEALLAKHKGEVTDDVANILFTEAKLYLQVLGDSDTSRTLADRLKRDFPKTKQGRMADKLLASVTAHEDSTRARAGFVSGAEFPGFEEKDVDRKPLSLSSYRGRVVLVDFWATWSKSCVAELDQTLKVYEKYHTQGFEIIGISLDVDEMLLTGFKARKGIPWQQFFDAGIWKNKLAVQCGIDSIPANYLLDREGKIIGKDLYGAALQKKVAQALSRK